MRYKQIRVVEKEDNSGQETIITLYIGKHFEVEQRDSFTNYRHFIGDVAIVDLYDNKPSQIAFTHRDRLGSTVTMTDHNDNTTSLRHFDPFGKPRGGDWSLLDSDISIATNRLQDNLQDQRSDIRRGFTDHEHLDEAELIHMNGRVYDYNVGRFMSVDPFMHLEAGSQGINPYSYIFNNPLAGTDPTGYDAEQEKPIPQKGTGTNIRGNNSVASSGIAGNAGAMVKESRNSGKSSSTNNGAQAQSSSNSLTNSAEEPMDILSPLNVKPFDPSGDYISKENPNNFNGVIYDTNSEETPFINQVFSELIDNADVYAKRVLTEAVSGLIENMPDAFAEASGYSSAEELISAVQGGSLSTATLMGIATEAVLRRVPGANKIEKLVEELRMGNDIRVGSIDEAREILEHMPELKPGPGNIMPGLRDRRNTYRGDLINKENPASPEIHPAGKHRDQPHYNLDLRDKNGVRQKPAIFIDN